jgi:hypothetical protein
LIHDALPLGDAGQTVLVHREMEKLAFRLSYFCWSEIVGFFAFSLKPKGKAGWRPATLFWFQALD